MYNNDPCPICGETRFSWGHIREGARVSYATNGFKAFWGFGMKEVNARQCDRCGNLQLFTTPVFQYVDQKEKPKRG